MRKSAFFLTSLLASATIPTIVSATHVMNPAVSTQIQQTLSELNEYRQAQQNAKIQDPNISYAIRKALVMADLLFDPTGKLNTSSIPLVKSSFISSSPLEYEAHMVKVLSQLDSSWQTFFDHVGKPDPSNTLSNLMLRSLFSLDAMEPLTDRHAKVAVLTALLSPYNQGPVGDCFAVADLVRDHEEFLLHSAQDYYSMLQNGYLTRLVDESPDYFFTLPLIADSDRDQILTIDSSGILASSKIPVLDTPGIHAACNVMGARGISNFSSRVIASLFQTASSQQIQVSVSQVINACAAVIATSNSSLDQGTLATQGNYAFSSLTNNPILRGIENAFAAMAEDRATDSTRTNINSCVMQGLSSFFSPLASQPNVSAFQTAFLANFNASYHLVYNPDIPLAQVSSDGSSTDGGFQLYKRATEAPTTIGIRIQTPDDFRNLVLDAVTLSKNQVQGSDQIATEPDKLYPKQ